MMNPVTQQQLKSEARQMKLVYTNDQMPGYTRKKKGNKFIFIGTDGKPISDEDINRRIRSLVLPPAWTQVWICTRENGHLQATGYDIAGESSTAITRYGRCSAMSISITACAILGAHYLKYAANWPATCKRKACPKTKWWRLPSA